MRQISSDIIVVLIMVFMLSTAANIITTIVAYNEYYKSVTGAFSESSGTINLVISHPPIFNKTIPNQTWRRYTSLTSTDLDDYFYDPDGDPLNYTASTSSYVNIIINPTSHVVTYDPVGAWWGVTYVTFTASDPYDMTNNSNVVTLNVTYVEPPTGGGSESSSGGGGGSSNIKPCIEDWRCTDWSDCSPTTKQQTRKCIDLNYCFTNYTKPAESRECSIPSCSDGIQNQNETGVDCGGPCPACPTCDDGIQNQGETGVDCGGPCPSCTFYAVKEVLARQPPWVHIGLILIAVFLIELYIYRIRRYKKKMIVWRRL